MEVSPSLWWRRPHLQLALLLVEEMPLSILTIDGPNLQKDTSTILPTDKRLCNWKWSSDIITIFLFCNAKAIWAEGEGFFS